MSPPTTTDLDDTILQAEVYYQYTRPVPPASTRVTPDILSGALDAIALGTTSIVDTYVRSQYVSTYGLKISKQYTNATHATLYPDDLIQARISIENTSASTIKNIEYLDTVPKIFSLEKTLKYRVKVGNTNNERSVESI